MTEEIVATTLASASAPFFLGGFQKRSAKRGSSLVNLWWIAGETLVS
jgi:hypothetical protein